MKTSLNSIVECLADYGAQLSETVKKDFSFSGVQILTSPSEKLSEDILYVCMPKVLPKLKKPLFENHCFVFKARPAQIQCNHELHGVIVSENSDLSDVINRLISFFTQIHSFEYSIKEAALRRQGLEPFFDIARNAFPDCLMVVTDSAFNIISATKKKTGIEYLDKLIEQGYYSRKDLDLMAAYGYYDDERKYFRPVLYEKEKTICGRPFLVRSYRKNGVAFSFVGCYFRNHEPLERELDMFNCFSHEIELYYEQNGEYDVGLLGTRQQLMDDIINPKKNTSDYFRDRSVRLHIPYQANYRMGVVQSENSSLIKTSQIANQLSAHCPLQNFGIFQYFGNIIILFSDWTNSGVRAQSAYTDDLEMLLETLRQNKAYIGFSLAFPDVTKIGVAYKQSLAAIDVGRKSRQNEQAFFYSQYYLDDILRHYDSVIPLDDIYTRQLNQLMDDNVNVCSNMKLLYYYLCSERSISLTAKYIHMHRNSVIYRIKKIQEIVALDMNDPDVRMRLLISFKILEITGKIPKWERPMSEEADDGEENTYFQE